MFDSLADDEFLKARTRANPYERIKGAIFQNRYIIRKLTNCCIQFDLSIIDSAEAKKKSNKSWCISLLLLIYRAAMKMANMDAVFDFMFSCPRDKDQVSYHM